MEYHTFLWVVFGFILGTILGSFIKALADRSLLRKKFWGRSKCPYCKTALSWYDLLPILSYLFLKGKCRYCHKNIGVEYLMVEIVMGVLTAFLIYRYFHNFNYSAYPVHFLPIIFLDILSKIFFITVLAALFLTDIKKMLIPDRIIIPSIIVGLILGIILAFSKTFYLYYNLSQTPFGRHLLPPESDYFRRHAVLIFDPFIFAVFVAILTGGFFWGLIIITKGKGMGGGDVKLGAFLGIMLGFPNAVISLVLAFLIGAIFSLILIAFGKKKFGATIPFGPFLVIGSLISLFWGSQIFNWYINLSPFVIDNFF